MLTAPARDTGTDFESALGLLVLQQGAGGAVIPLLGALALGAQRLLPALQQVYGG